MKLSETLKKTKALIQDPKNWCQVSYCKTAEGIRTDIGSPDAAQFCLMGAFYKASGCEKARDGLLLRGRSFLHDLAEREGHPDAATLNDRGTHETVMAFLDKAITAATLKETTNEGVGSTTEGQGTDPEPRALDPG